MPRFCMWAKRLVATASHTCFVLRPCTAVHSLPTSAGHCSAAVLDSYYTGWTACRGLCSSPDSSSEGTQASTSSRLLEPRRQPRSIPRWSNNAEKCANPLERLPSGAELPWTPTSQLTKRKVYPKRMRHILRLLKDEHQSELAMLRPKFPQIRPGYVISVDLVVPENNNRTTTCTGIVMAIKHNGPMTRFTVRYAIKGTGPVERSFLLLSPFLKAITIHHKEPVRRAKLTYLRDRRDIESTFKL